MSLTVLITGATAGIGRQVAMDLAAAGHVVIAAGRDRTRLAALAARRVAGKIEPIVLDLTDADSIDSAAAQVREITGGRGVDILVNCAGYAVAGPTSEVTDARLRAQFDTNVFGLMALTRAVLPEMRARGTGRIVNISSVAGRVVVPLSGVYNASKFAVEALSDALRIELEPFGIRVVVVEPGAVRTDFSSTALRTAMTEQDTGPYAALMADIDAIAKRFDAGAVDVTRVARVIVRAATIARPRARYVVPFTGHLVMGAVAVLPARLTDALLRRAAGLTPARLRGTVRTA
jgi:short-subunit dehydrogenase